MNELQTNSKPANQAPPVVSSKDLLGHGREVVIIHGEQKYRLCVTSSNKLILIK